MSHISYDRISQEKERGNRLQTILISANKLDKIQTCHRLFSYTSIKELGSFSKPSYMDEGDLFHKLLELYYRAKKEVTDYNIESLIELGRNHAAALTNISQEEIEQNINLFREYILYYQQESWIPQEVEIPFAFSILEDEDAGLRIVLEGKIDLLAKDEKTGQELVIDHKRVGRNSTPYDRDNQKLSYCLVTGRRDFIINQIGDQKSLSVDKRLSRYYFNISQHMIDEFVENTIYWTFEMLKIMKMESEGETPPGNYRGCTMYFNKCAFYDVCNTTPDNREYKLNQQYLPRGKFDLFEGSK